jgi:hypothetical protein
MKMSGSEKLIEQSRPGRAVLCAKCEHLNPHDRSVCERCGSHLYVVCHSCGSRNERVRSRCIDCSRKLHRSWFGRLLQALFGKNRKMSLIQTVLLLIGILIGIAVIVLLAEFKLPQP